MNTGACENAGIGAGLRGANEQNLSNEAFNGSSAMRPF